MRTLLIARLGLVVVSVLLALGIGEAAVRLRPAFAYDLEALDAIAAGDRQVSFDPTLGWLPTPAVERTANGVVYRHNAAGLRVGQIDQTYSAAPAPGVRRIAAYGDSFTYCATVSMGQCWTKRLQDALPASEVMNFGVPAYGPDQAWLRYQREQADWQPCGVLIGVMLENVDRVVNRFRPFYYGSTGLPLAKPRFLVEQGRPVLLPNPAASLEQLRDPGWVAANLGPHDYWYAPGPSHLLDLAKASGRHGWNLAQAREMYRPGGEPLAVMTAVVAGFAEQVRANGASPVVLLFPSDVEIIEQRDRQPKPHQPLLDALAARGLTVIDLSDPLGRATRDRKLGELIAVHYRPAGNALVAETLARKLPSQLPTCQDR